MTLLIFVILPHWTFFLLLVNEFSTFQSEKEKESLHITQERNPFVFGINKTNEPNDDNCAINKL